MQNRTVTTTIKHSHSECGCMHCFASHLHEIYLIMFQNGFYSNFRCKTHVPVVPNAKQLNLVHISEFPNTLNQPASQLLHSFDANFRGHTFSAMFVVLE